jgi:hypothetical protein
MKAIKAWKEWHRRQGWDVRGNVAIPPDGGELRAIALREYDGETRKRVA